MIGNLLDSRIRLVKIFSGNSNRSLVEKIAKELKIKLSELEIRIFSDGEKRVRVIEEVAEQDCVVVQSTSPTPDQNYMELFFIADALKRSGAKTVSAVIPYLGYQRQDHVFRTGEAVSLQVIVKTLEAVGISRILALDLHSIRIQSLFRLPFVHLSALPLFAKVIREKNWDDGKTVLVSPDMGGIRRIKIISEELTHMPYVSIEKNRDLESGRVTAGKINGKIAPRAIIVDDMISGGGTIAVAAELLRKNGAEEVFVFATHPVFSNDFKKNLQKAKVKKIFVTDTIEIGKEKRFPKLEILSVAKMIAEEIKKNS